jgi:hypothetical protein
MDKASNANENGDTLVIHDTTTGMFTWLTNAPENININKMTNTERKLVTIGLPVHAAMVVAMAALDMACNIVGHEQVRAKIESVNRSFRRRGHKMKSRILTTMDSNKTNRVLERPKRPWSSLLVGCPWGLVSQMWGCTIAPWHPDWLKNAADSTYLASWNIEKQRELIGN